jgi:hypothetical protein
MTDMQKQGSSVEAFVAQAQASAMAEIRPIVRGGYLIGYHDGVRMAVTILNAVAHGIRGDHRMVMQAAFEAAASSIEDKARAMGEIAADAFIETTPSLRLGKQ